MPTQQTTKYDVIFIGTSTICVMEAVYQSCLGRRVLMIDEQEKIGGAWIAFDLFGLHDIENGVHYFLDDPIGFRFMQRNLGWRLVTSPQKYWILPKGVRLPRQAPFNSLWGQLVGRGLEYSLRRKGILNPKDAMDMSKEIWATLRRKSRYVEGGSPEMIEKVSRILKNSSVEVKLGHFIDKIDISSMKNEVQVHAKGENYLAEKIYFTHGSKLNNLYLNGKKVAVNEQVHLRPQIHLFVQDKKPAKIFQGVFIRDPLIKYTHDVTRFTQEAKTLAKEGKKVFCIALQHLVQEEDKIYRQVMDRMIEAGILGENARLLGKNWWNARLPSLDDTELERLKSLFSPNVEILRTENFPPGIGYYAKKWESKIAFKRK
jgi:hypothetical protein